MPVRKIRKFRMSSKVNLFQHFKTPKDYKLCYTIRYFLQRLNIIVFQVKGKVESLLGLVLVDFCVTRFSIVTSN